MAETKVEELERIKARVQATLEQNPNGLTAEKNLEVEALMQKARGLQAEIVADRALEQKKVDLANLDEFLNKPEQKVPHGIGDGDGESEDRKALRNAGWEFKNGIVLAPTSLGKHIEMFAEEVLYGPIPQDDPDAAAYFKSTRAAFRPEYRAAYSKLLRLSVKTRTESMAFSMLSGVEQKALSEGLDTAGGFLVPPDVQAEVLVRVAQMAVMRKYATVQTTSRDILQWPAVAPASSTTGGVAAGGASIFSSAFVGGWVGETPAFSDTDPAFQMFGIPIRKLRVATKLSNDFVADSAVNILAFLAQNGAENMALVEDFGFFQGDGGSLQPKGILNSGASTVDVEGSTSNTISNTTSNTGSAPKIAALPYALPAQYAGRARWIMRRAIEGDVRALVNANGDFLWPPFGGLVVGSPAQLMGYPTDNSDFMPDDGTDANKVMLFGDLSKYIIAQRAQITSTILRERFADVDQVGIILFERVGGDMWNTDAIRIGIV